MLRLKLLSHLRFVSAVYIKMLYAFHISPKYAAFPVCLMHTIWLQTLNYISDQEGLTI